MRDSSLKVPPGVGGIVINARVFSRKGTEKDERAKDIEDQERARLERTRDEEIKILRDSFFRRSSSSSSGKTTTGKLVDDKGKVLLQKGAMLDDAQLDEIPRKYWAELPVDDAEEIAQIARASSKRSSASAKSTSATRSIASPRATSCRRASSRW